MATANDALAFVHSMNKRNRKSIPDFMAKRFPPVYVYNIYPREQVRLLGSLGRFVIPACEPGKPYSKPLIVNGFIADEYDLGDGKGNMSWNAEAGEDVARDVVGYKSYSAELSPVSTNYEWWGCFIAKGEVPTKEELDEAHAKLEKCMKMWLAEGDRLSLQGEKGLEQIGIPHREAAMWLKQPRKWCDPAVAMIECPGCGTAVKPFIAKCGSCGAILDRVKAIELGLIPDETAPTPLTKVKQ